MILRRYFADDFPALYAVEMHCFDPRFRFGKRFMERLIGNPQSATWIAEEDGVIAGFSIVTWGSDARCDGGYLQTIEVEPQFRSRGVAIKLLSLAEISVLTANTLSISLHVDSENRPAIRLYEKCGYRRRGRREDYYARGRDALRYVKLLDPVDELSLQSLGFGSTAA